MSDPAALVHEPSAPGAAARDAACLDRRLAMLGRLAEAGLEIAIALEAQAKGGPVAVEGDIAIAYNRVARAVRQTLMLQSRLIESQRTSRTDEAGRRAAARSSAARILRGALEDHDSDAERSERLTAEAAERLQREDFGDLLARPFGQIVTAICKDLGLSPDWLQLAQDCAEAEAALAGTPGAAPQEEAYDGPITVRWLSGTPGRSRDSS